MKLTVRHDLDDEAQRTQARREWLLSSIKARLRSVSFALERRIKLEMPVDTGRARASWGHWSGGVRGNAEGGPGDAVWAEEDRGLSIKQGSNVEYIQYLNDGHSQQAPAGFLDVAEEWAVERLDAEIDSIMEQW